MIVCCVQWCVCYEYSMKDQACVCVCVCVVLCVSDMCVSMYTVHMLCVCVCFVVV